MLVHQGTKTIETMRLVLRQFKEEDAGDMFYNWASDPAVCKYLLWGPYTEVETSRRRIIQWLRSYERENSYVWAIERKSNQQAIGLISVEVSNELTMSCEVGYCIGQDYWGRGIMTEALLAVLHYLFYEVGYQRIFAKHDVLNPASGRVMQKAGMHLSNYEYQVGQRRDGSYYDCAVYEKYITED